MTRAFLVAAAFVAIVQPGFARAEDLAFDRLRVFLERNVTDRDAEIKIEATAGVLGLSSLKVLAPDGRVVVDFNSPGSKIGIRHFALETPEPENDGRVQKDFPAGTYSFDGRTTSGSRLVGKAVLSHDFPEVAALIRPRPDATGIPAQGLTIRWHSAAGVEAHVVVLEQEVSGQEIRARLSGKTTSFTVPDGFLEPGTEYKLAIGTVAKGGNASFMETAFTTAKP